MGENVTIHDVAEEAKVSIATVSRVLNNLGSVKESTRERVFQAMRTVGYPIPNMETSTQQGSKTILVMITNLGNFFTGKELDGIFSAAYYGGYDCVIYRQKSETYSLEDMCAVAEAVDACGILMSLPNVPAEIMKKLAEIYPVVQFSEFVENCPVPFVSVDDYNAAKLATSYVLKMGKRRVALLNGPKRFKYARERERGYVDALMEYAIEPDPSLMVNMSTIAPSAVQSVTSRLIGESGQLDAVVCAADSLAASVITAAHTIGRNVPKDMAVISCEDTELAQMIVPSLTSVSQPIFHIGEQACKMLLDIIDGHRPTPDQIFLNVQLVVRESA